MSEDRTGTTFALEPRTRRMLAERFSVEPSSRIFISHDTRKAFEETHGPMLRQIVVLLTGLGEDRLADLGGPVEFREPVTGQVRKRLTFGG